jgi:hypothetical protein
MNVSPEMFHNKENSKPDLLESGKENVNKKKKMK